MNWHPFLLSLKVTTVATVLLFIVGLALAMLLARRRFPGQTVLETAINLPLVLPPSVVGYYLLLALGRGSPIVEWLGWQILFTWQAAAIASAVVGLPLMVQSARAAIANVDPTLENAARTLGSSEPEVFWRVTLPLARRGILAGLVLGAARALGEFGATLMVAGNIPGRTQTLPMAIYDAVLNRQYGMANQMALLMTALAFFSLWWVRRIEQPKRTPQRISRITQIVSDNKIRVHLRNPRNQLLTDFTDGAE
jgi:molybdate transport system permease protein